MTVAADLYNPEGPPRRMYAMIDGLELILWEAGAPALAIDSRPGVDCLLRPGEEHSAGALDLAKMEVRGSGLTLKLIDFPDPSAPTTYYFAKLFAPGRWARSDTDRTYLEAGPSDDARLYVDADATIIPTSGCSGFPSSGDLHIGQETVSYSGNTGLAFVGCTKGMYPCVGTSFGSTYRRPGPSEDSDKLPISSVPYSWNNRRVALYVTTKDPATEVWNTPGELVWVGRITGEITYSPSECCWIMSCRNILEDLDRKICVDMPSSPLHGINLLGGGTYGHQFWIFECQDGIPVAQKLVTIPQRFYSGWKDLAAELSDILNDKTTGGSGSGDWEIGTSTITYIVKSGGILCINIATSGNPITVKIQQHMGGYGGLIAGLQFCHALLPLGFDGTSTVESGPINYHGAGNDAAMIASGTPANAFHPLSTKFNGGKLGVGNARPFWEYQGDTSSWAVVELRGAKTEDDREPVVHQYLGSSDDTSSGKTIHCLDLLVTQPSGPLDYSGGYVIQREGEEPIEVRQCYMPGNWGSRGGFYQLLYPLLSTGTDGYNDATFDKLPLSLSVGMQAALVDGASFIAADSATRAAYPDLAWRGYYIINEPISFRKLLQRECMLFGYFLAWDMSQGKLSLKSAYSHDTHLWTVSLNESTPAVEDEKPDATSDAGDVVNVYKLELGNSKLSGRPLKVTVTDNNSVVGLQLTREVSVKHPGVSPTFDETSFEDIVRRALTGQGERAFPWQKCDVTLAAWLIKKVSTGDVVQVARDTMPDQYGSGLYGATALGIVTDGPVWNYGKWSGKATVRLYSRYDGDSKAPWAASALVDKSAANGGWDDASDTLTLTEVGFGETGNNDDGEALASGYVMIIERAPANPAAPLIWGPIEVVGYTAGTLALELAASTTLASWDATKEYVVVPADYSACPEAQQSSNAFQADPVTRLLGAADQAQRWG